MCKKNRIMLFSLLVIIAITCCAISSLKSNSVVSISNIHSETKDDVIAISWELDNQSIWTRLRSKIRIDVVGEQYNKSFIVNSGKNQFPFQEGKDGKCYSFKASVVSGKKVISESDVVRALYVDLNDLPAFPLISITTENYVDPVCEYVSAPNEMCMGQSITNNDYVKGNLVLSQKGKPDISSEMKIRIRGNTSAYTDKKPYKLVLDKPVDLLDREGNQYTDTDWMLIKNNGLETNVGNYIANLLGSEWQPQFTFVNVILNGDWKGSYLLVETIDKGEEKVNIEKSGFIIEDDAYWWNEDGKYFKSNSQLINQPEDGGVGFTYKYPGPNKVSESRAKQIKTFIDEFEYVLYTDLEDSASLFEARYQDYIDVDSFSSWVLVHDILGTWDSAGSNIFLYKENLVEGDERQSKMKIGPAWDFDSNYMMDGKWADIHTNGRFYYPALFEDEAFVNAYKTKWNEISYTMYQDVMDYLYALKAECGDAIQRSWDLDAERWNVPAQSLDEKIGEAENWFSSRTIWMNNAVAELSHTEN